MVSRFLIDIESAISPARLHRYRSATDNELGTVVNYFWNMALSEALYCSLNAVEIALRNSIHQTLTAHFGGPAWYDQKGLLDQRQVDGVAAVKERIRRDREPVTPDRIVSELSFGFWVIILSRNYDIRLWQGQHAAPLRQAFPRVPRRQRQRQTIHQHYNAIRELRNRVFHHEPLFDDRVLGRRHLDIYRGIGWINPGLLAWVEGVDRFPIVLATGRGEVQSTLRRHLDLP